MENIQGYEIEKSVLFENSRGFALGHNPAAPQPYVTWQFTENEGGVRDYYWGHYHKDKEWAERDFSRRTQDYQYLFNVEEKEPGQEPGGYYRYYSTQRPFDIGATPDTKDNPLVEVVNYEDDRRRSVAGGKIHAWGEAIYKKPLTGKQVRDYELTPAPDSPDRKRSITARLKEGRQRERSRRRSPGRSGTTRPMRTDRRIAMHEKDNYLKTAELSTEQNQNMIDGVPNNTPLPPEPPELDKKPLDKVKEPKERRKGRELER